MQRSQPGSARAQAVEIARMHLQQLSKELEESGTHASAGLSVLYSGDVRLVVTRHGGLGERRVGEGFLDAMAILADGGLLGARFGTQVCEDSVEYVPGRIGVQSVGRIEARMDGGHVVHIECIRRCVLCFRHGCWSIIRDEIDAFASKCNTVTCSASGHNFNRMKFVNL